MLVMNQRLQLIYSTQAKNNGTHWQYKPVCADLSGEKIMKVKENYELKKVLDDYMVIPKGSAMKTFSGTIVLSETAAFAWEKLQQDVTTEELIQSVLEEFEAEPEQVERDVLDLIEKLKTYDVLEAAQR